MAVGNARFPLKAALAGVWFRPIADISAPGKLTCMEALLVPLAALLQAASAYPADPDCSNSGDGSPYAMNQCYYSQSQEWDRRLNAEYQAAMKRIDVNKAKLRASQRSWLHYRDANCAVYAAVKGSDGKLLANACWRDMTRARTLELREMSWTG